MGLLLYATPGSATEVQVSSLNLPAKPTFLRHAERPVPAPLGKEAEPAQHRPLVADDVGHLSTAQLRPVAAAFSLKSPSVKPVHQVCPLSSSAVWTDGRGVTSSLPFFVSRDMTSHFPKPPSPRLYTGDGA